MRATTMRIFPKRIPHPWVYVKLLLFIAIFGCAGLVSAMPSQLGSKKVLVMLVDFPDYPNTAPSVASVSQAMSSVHSFYWDCSFNQLSLSADVIGPFRMPQNASAYVATFNVAGLRNDAFAAARMAGVEPNNYDYDITAYTQPAGVGGIIYAAEWSQTLALPGNWTAIADTGDTSASPPQHTFSVPIDTKAKLYLRLKVTNPNP